MRSLLLALLLPITAFAGEGKVGFAPMYSLSQDKPIYRLWIDTTLNVRDTSGVGAYAQTESNARIAPNSGYLKLFFFKDFHSIPARATFFAEDNYGETYIEKRIGVSFEAKLW